MKTNFQYYLFPQDGSSLKVYEMLGKFRVELTGEVPSFDNKSLVAQLKRLVVALERQQPKEDDGRKTRQT